MLMYTIYTHYIIISIYHSKFKFKLLLFCDLRSVLVYCTVRYIRDGYLYLSSIYSTALSYLAYCILRSHIIVKKERVKYEVLQNSSDEEPSTPKNKVFLKENGRTTVKFLKMYWVFFFRLARTHPKWSDNSTLVVNVYKENLSLTLSGTNNFSHL